VSEISLAQYAQKHGRTPDAVRQLTLRGGLRTARKIGRNWVVDSDEPYPDARRKEEPRKMMWFGVEALPPYDVNMVNSNGNPVGALHAFDSEEEAKRWNQEDRYIGGTYNRYLLDRRKAKKMMIARITGRIEDLPKEMRGDVKKWDDEGLYSAYCWVTVRQ
jgi:hypothetical protein